MSTETRTSAFDIRLIIALLLGIYGLVLTVLGLFFVTDEDNAKSAGVNVNLWTGLGMLVFGVLMIAWALWRPAAPKPRPTGRGSSSPAP